MITDPKEVCFYDEKTRKLFGNRFTKSKKFIEQDLVEDQGAGNFLVHPIPGYNKTTYSVHVSRSFEGNSCSCQFGNKGKVCSHLLAVSTFLDNKAVPQ